MIPFFDHIRGMSALSMVISMLLAVLCGGLIGVERELKRRPAGFRTHILICLGACITTLVSKYLVFGMGAYTDIARLGAQVIAGVGFIGAGTIIVTKRQRIKGLTTAAGLWAVAIVGLSLGAGFYEAGMITTAMILFAELVFSRLEYRILAHTPEINIIMEYEERRVLDAVLRDFHRCEVKIVNLEITHQQGNEHSYACAIFTLRLNKNKSREQILEQVRRTAGVQRAEEI